MANGYLDRNEAIRSIRRGLKARGGNYSVTGGRGTVWGWITIDLLPSIKTATPVDDWCGLYGELAVMLGFDRSRGYTSFSVAASNEYYREYIDRAEGRPPAKIAEPYWD
jgi:hypothetical protein